MAARAYAISLGLSFLVKDPMVALVITLLPTRAERRTHKVVHAVADALSRTPLESIGSMSFV